MYKIIFYQKENGEIPVQAFLDSLDISMRTKMLYEIELLELLGTRLREPHSKYLGNKILELRAVSGNNISRVLYFFVAGERIVLTHGFIKKTQKTPKQEIERAIKYMKSYIDKGADGNDYF